MKALNFESKRKLCFELILPLDSYAGFDNPDLSPKHPYLKSREDFISSTKAGKMVSSDQAVPQIHHHFLKCCKIARRLAHNEYTWGNGQILQVICTLKCSKFTRCIACNQCTVHDLEHFIISECILIIYSTTCNLITFQDANKLVTPPDDFQ